MYRNRIAIDDISIVNNQSCKLLPSAASVKPIDIHSIKKGKNDDNDDDDGVVVGCNAFDDKDRCC